MFIFKFITAGRFISKYWEKYNTHIVKIWKAENNCKYSFMISFPERKQLSMSEEYFVAES